MSTTALCRYGLVGQKMVETGAAVELFDVDEVTGIVRTRVQIDRDRLCIATLRCLVQLDILVRPGPPSLSSNIYAFLIIFYTPSL